ncbi:MAG: nucleotide pyrophosphatase/phosphodiesterase family protein [Phycisphaeraceae bacterium]
MTPTAVILVVGLNTSLIGDDCPRLRDFTDRNTLRRLKPVLPAVTCTVQSSMLTGLPPSQHGIVGNGWFNREQCEVQFWKQANPLVQGEKVWDTARKRDAKATTLNMFWWFNMYSGADWSVTPRPMYKADGRKLPDCYSHPPVLRDELQAKLGQFPLFNFWGPGSSIASSRWIADATMLAHAKHDPTLTLVYLPHLDYALQKFGPVHDASWKAVREIDAVIGDLIDYFTKKGVQPIIVSEYGIEEVTESVPINRILRQAGHLKVRVEEGLELLDAGASDAFAVADHQVAHVYVKGSGFRVPGSGLNQSAIPDPQSAISHVADLCRAAPGVEQVLTREEQRAIGLDHARSGELVLVAAPGRWFSYDYWLDDSRAPDFARTVDIHRKPGYDPLELFLDPTIRFPKLKIAWRLFQRKILKQRKLLDVIPLDTKLVRGSHGRINQPPEMMPVLITPRSLEGDEDLPCTMVRDVILEHLFD